MHLRSNVFETIRIVWRKHWYPDQRSNHSRFHKNARPSGLLARGTMHADLTGDQRLPAEHLCVGLFGWVLRRLLAVMQEQVVRSAPSAVHWPTCPFLVQVWPKLNCITLMLFHSCFLFRGILPSAKKKSCVRIASQLLFATPGVADDSVAADMPRNGNACFWPVSAAIGMPGRDLANARPETVRASG